MKLNKYPQGYIVGSDNEEEAREIREAYQKFRGGAFSNGISNYWKWFRFAEPGNIWPARQFAVRDDSLLILSYKEWKQAIEEQNKPKMKKAKCIEDTGNLTNDKMYEVIREDKHFYWLINDTGKESFYYHRRFVPIDGDDIKNGRKIIGYKAPTDLFLGMVKKGEVYSLMDSQNGLYSCQKSLAVSTTGSYWLPKEIVEKWESVYEELEKTLIVGKPEKIVTVKGGNACIDSYMFGKDVVEYLYKSLRDLPVTIIGLSITPSLWIGCEQGTSINKQDLETLLKELK